MNEPLFPSTTVPRPPNVTLGTTKTAVLKIPKNYATAHPSSLNKLFVAQGGYVGGTEQNSFSQKYPFVLGATTKDCKGDFGIKRDIHHHVCRNKSVHAVHKVMQGSAFSPDVHRSDLNSIMFHTPGL